LHGGTFIIITIIIIIIIIITRRGGVPIASVTAYIYVKRRGWQICVQSTAEGRR